jgi:hypothetical protein
VTYFAVVEPVNQRLRPLPPGVVPEDFAALRAQWEFGHATEFALFLVAFVFLVVSAGVRGAEATQSQAVGDDEHRAECHRRTGEHRVEQPGRS